MLISGETITIHSKLGRYADTKYRYHVVRTGAYRATMIEHLDRPDLIGLTNVHDHEVAGSRLIVRTNPQNAKPKPVVDSVRTESISIRYVEGCPINTK